GCASTVGLPGPLALRQAMPGSALLAAERVAVAAGHLGAQRAAALCADHGQEAQGARRLLRRLASREVDGVLPGARRRLRVARAAGPGWPGRPAGGPGRPGRGPRASCGCCTSGGGRGARRAAGCRGAARGGLLHLHSLGVPERSAFLHQAELRVLGDALVQQMRADFGPHATLPRQYVPDVPDEYFRLPGQAPKSDVVRYALIYHQGGLYMD
ncbi:unnamed protein product, partial [Prorocentrum cordatum]